MNCFSIKLEKNLKSCKDLLEKLQEASKEDKVNTKQLEGEMESSVFSPLMVTKLFTMLKHF